MKQLIFEIIRKIKLDPSLMRKVKIFAVVGLTGFILTAALTVWAVVSAVSYAVSTANQVILSEVAQKPINNVKTELQNLEPQLLNCWGKVQHTLTNQSWLEKNTLDNLRNLAVSCLNPNPEPHNKAEKKTI